MQTSVGSKRRGAEVTGDSLKARSAALTSAKQTREQIREDIPRIKIVRLSLPVPSPCPPCLAVARLATEKRAPEPTGVGEEAR